MKRLAMHNGDGEVQVAVGPDGSIEYVGPNAEAAVAAARDVGDFVLIDPPEAPLPHPASKNSPLQSLKASGLPEISHAEVEAMSLQEAYDRVSPFFLKMRWFAKPIGGKKQRWRTGREVEKNLTPKGLVEGMLTENYKTGKRIEGMAKTIVMGLSLLPHALVQEVIRQPEFSMFEHDLDGLDLPKNFTLCTHSTDECRATCLTYTGHNWMVFYNAMVKCARTIAFLREPVAFVKLLFEACKKVARSKTAYHFIRLNVLSDVCWELVCPWIFEKTVKPNGKKVQFYDYTKVDGRVTPENYDLTFSYSGKNKAAAMRELERGRRLAVVFIGFKREGDDGWTPLGKLKGEDLVAAFPKLPETFLGFPVVDGDESDLRALEPGGVVVGLRFKSSGLKDQNVDWNKFAFATRAHIVSDREAYVPAERDVRENPGRGGLQYLVAAQTPRGLEHEYDPTAEDEEGEEQFEELADETDGEIDITPGGQLGMAP